MDKVLRTTLRTHLSYIADTATLAQRVASQSDLCDLLDDIDAHLQAAIEVLRTHRHNQVGGIYER